MITRAYIWISSLSFPFETVFPLLLIFLSVWLWRLGIDFVAISSLMYRLVVQFGSGFFLDCTLAASLNTQVYRMVGEADCFRGLSSFDTMYSILAGAE